MAEAAVQTLDISPVGRVEGDLDVRVEIAERRRRQCLDPGRTVSRLRNHPAGQGPASGSRRDAARLRHLRRLASDLRGLGARHGLGHRRCRATPSSRAISGRLTESLQSLPRHHYGLFMIDYTNKTYSSSRNITKKR